MTTGASGRLAVCGESPVTRGRVDQNILSDMVGSLLSSYGCPPVSKYVDFFFYAPYEDGNMFLSLSQMCYVYIQQSVASSLFLTEFAGFKSKTLYYRGV